MRDYLAEGLQRRPRCNQIISKGLHRYLIRVKAPSMPSSAAVAAFANLMPTVTGSRPLRGPQPKPSGVRALKSTRWPNEASRARCRSSRAKTGRFAGQSGHIATCSSVIGWSARSATRKRCRFCSGFIVTPSSRRSRQQIDAIADDANALTEQARTEQIGEIDRDRLAVQREEEHWVGKAIDGGMTMLRRPDADPRAVLGLADDMPAPMNA